jgi:hypothetical protein
VKKTAAAETKIAARRIEVVATQRITEENFMGRKLWTHARKGDRGVIIDVDPDDGVPTVRFYRSGTATGVDIGGDVKLAL